jgi:hypothetical protein
MTQWQIDRKSVLGAAVCLLFAATALVAPADALVALTRGSAYQRSVAAFIWQGWGRYVIAAFLVAVAVFALRAPGRRRRGTRPRKP